MTIRSTVLPSGLTVLSDEMPTVESASVGRPQCRCKSASTALPANHTDAPANCEATIAGRMRRGRAATGAALSCGSRRGRARRTSAW